MSTKKKAKKSAPKPSTLLKEAFALFNGGKNWIKGNESIKAGTFVDSYGDETWVEDPRGPLPKGVKKLEEGAFCSIGALREIDTANEEKAVNFLRLAVALESDESDWYEVIEETNDSDKTKFKDVTRWFNRAIKMAQAVGQ